jgi:post-segregation antitoxin (ccd killing protein)
MGPMSEKAKLSAARTTRIELARRAIQNESPMDGRRETRWQYENRLATAAVDALFIWEGVERDA